MHPTYVHPAAVVIGARIVEATMADKNDRTAVDAWYAQHDLDDVASVEVLDASGLYVEVTFADGTARKFTAFSPYPIKG